MSNPNAIDVPHFSIDQTSSSVYEFSTNNREPVKGNEAVRSLIEDQMASKRKAFSAVGGNAPTPSASPGMLQVLPATIEKVTPVPQEYLLSQRVFGVLFYAASSILIMMVNKVALYVWGFPSVASLALAQFLFSAVSLRILKALGVISFPDPSIAGLKAVFPLPLLYVGNAVSGLSGTKALSLPMFTVLRRTNMLITMALEYWLLGATYSFEIKLSIAMMMFGSILATLLDMQFDLLGYLATFLNNMFTSVGGVMTKVKLNSAEKEDEKQALTSMWGLMYLNSLVGAPLLFIVLLLFYPETLKEAYAYEFWYRIEFVSMFLMSSAMGTVLQLSIFYCTKVNSALTTVVTGVLKNVLTSYAGMMDSRLGYTFNALNFVGINVSMIGGIWYAYIQFVESSAKSKPPTVNVAAQGKVEGATDEEAQTLLVHSVKEKPTVT